MNPPRHAVIHLLWLILSITCACSMEFYVAKIWSAGQPPNFSDLYAPWWGAHELFLHKRNPYSTPVAHEIQAVIYGAPTIAPRPGDPSEIAGGYAYPLYTAFFLWPVVHMRFPAVQILLICISAAATLGSLLICLRGIQYRGSLLLWLALVFFTCGSFPVLEGLRLGNLSLVAAGMLMLSIFLLARGRLTFAGVVLAAATFKPQFTILLVPWLAVWTLSNWRRRQSLVWSFMASMAVLIAASEWLMPAWIGNFLHVLAAYKSYTFGRSLLDVWFTHGWGQFASAAVIVATTVLCWRYRRFPAHSPATFVAISVVLAATLVIIPTLAPHTQILLLPGTLCLLRYGPAASSSNRFGRPATLAVWLLLGWPWAAVTVMTASAIWVPLSALSQCWQVPLFTSPILPLALLVALGFLIRGHKWPQAELGCLP
jgi:hypothetical protein